MSITLEDLAAWMDDPEDEHLEFKEARNRFDFELLVKYCAALANERGGRLILGITDQRPRRVVGSEAFPELAQTKSAIIDRLHLRVEAEEIAHPDGKVIVLTVPSRPIGRPIEYRGAYWMRRGQDLVAMTPDMLERIFAESGPDFSAQICAGATMDDLSPTAIETFRELWKRSSGNAALAYLTVPQLLADAELVVNGGITYAALILLGTWEALGRYLAQAEVIFEYRSGETSGRAQQRLEFRQGFLTYHDDLWSTINLRNDRQQFEDGLFVWDIPTFNEVAVREAILNAVSHRDYRDGRSVFVRQYPRRLEIVSPGGFPPGITAENILWEQNPRNRRLAEALSKCSLIERSGQGVNRMFEECIKESKPRPDYRGSDDHKVFLTLYGEVQNPAFLRFLERVGQERIARFGTRDLLVLDLLARDGDLPAELRSNAQMLAAEGILERVGRGRGTRYILSRRFYEFLGKRGVYTRRRGLDHETNKLLLLRHIESFAGEGSPLGDLMQVLPGLSRDQVQYLLTELRKEGKAHHVGHGRGARWYPGPQRPDAARGAV